MGQFKPIQTRKRLLHGSIQVVKAVKIGKNDSVRLDMSGSIGWLTQLETMLRINSSIIYLIGSNTGWLTGLVSTGERIPFQAVLIGSEKTKIPKIPTAWFETPQKQGTQNVPAHLLQGDHSLYGTRGVAH
jgi:hypothetical protein